MFIQVTRHHNSLGDGFKAGPLFLLKDSILGMYREDNSLFPRESYTVIYLPYQQSVTVTETTTEIEKMLLDE